MEDPMPDQSPSSHGPCPICSKPAPPSKYKPFCSKRCADVDLSRWLNGAYAIPGAPLEDDEDSVGHDAPRRQDSGD